RARARARTRRVRRRRRMYFSFRWFSFTLVIVQCRIRAATPPRIRAATVAAFLRRGGGIAAARWPHGQHIEIAGRVAVLRDLRHDLNGTNRLELAEGTVHRVPRAVHAPSNRPPAGV